MFTTINWIDRLQPAPNFIATTGLTSLSGSHDIGGGRHCEVRVMWLVLKCSFKQMLLCGANGASKSSVHSTFLVCKMVMHGFSLSQHSTTTTESDSWRRRGHTVTSAPTPAYLPTRTR